MDFILGLICGAVVTAALAQSKINDLNLIIANLQHKLHRANEK